MFYLRRPLVSFPVVSFLMVSTLSFAAPIQWDGKTMKFGEKDEIVAFFSSHPKGPEAIDLITEFARVATGKGGSLETVQKLVLQSLISPAGQVMKMPESAEKDAALALMEQKTEAYGTVMDDKLLEITEAVDKDLANKAKELGAKAIVRENDQYKIGDLEGLNAFLSFHASASPRDPFGGPIFPLEQETPILYSEMRTKLPGKKFTKKELATAIFECVKAEAEAQVKGKPDVEFMMSIYVGFWKEKLREVFFMAAEGDDFRHDEIVVPVGTYYKSVQGALGGRF